MVQAYVVYEDIFDAKNACEHLQGFNVMGRYLIVVYYRPEKVFARIDREKEKEEIEKMKNKYNVSTDENNSNNKEKA